jgi:hypothetical protein
LKETKRKKELISQYKEREVIGGVYVIKNTLNNKMLFAATTDLRASINRFDFSQKTGSCVDAKLQNDWNRQGGATFALEVLEELKKGEKQSAEEFKDDVEVLREMRLEELSGKDLY